MPDLWLVWVHPTADPGSRAVLALSSTPHVQPLDLRLLADLVPRYTPLRPFWVWPVQVPGVLVTPENPCFPKKSQGWSGATPASQFGPTFRDPGTAQGGGEDDNGGDGR